MTARPIRYQRQVSDRNGKIFYTSIASLSHISKGRGYILTSPLRGEVLSVRADRRGLIKPPKKKAPQNKKLNYPRPQAGDN